MRRKEGWGWVVEPRGAGEKVDRMSGKDETLAI